MLFTIKKFLNKKRPFFVLAALMCTVAMLGSLTGCGSSSGKANAGNSEPKAKLTAIATTTMLSDLVSIIGGDNIEVTPLMGAGIDPHLYQASAGDVEKLQKADVVIYNGLHLEGKMGEVFAALNKSGRTTICGEDGLNKANLLADEDNPNISDPHIWFDTAIWKEVATHVAKRLGEIDQKNAESYNANLQKYLAQLDELDRYIKSRANELNPRQRILITAHDAFRYFGRAYKFEVKGLQGISTDAEAGTGDVSELAEFITNNKIKAIFVESSVPQKNIEALQAAVKARGFDVAIGGELYSDSLGDKAHNTETYVLTCKANIDTIVNALK